MPQSGRHTNVDALWKKQIRYALHLLFDLSVRHLYKIESRGLENFSRAPSTIVVTNHRRDSDGPVIGSVLLHRKLLHLYGISMNFVSREDMFHPGFLTKYLEHWPAAMRVLLSPLNLGSVLTIMQLFPMRRVAERSLGEVLEEVIAVAGDLPLDEVLRPQWLEIFREAAGSSNSRLHVSDVLKFRYRDLLFLSHGLAKLRLRCFREVAPYERAAVAAHLEQFCRLLEEGKTLVLAPEGKVSTDGRTGRFRAGLHTLLNQPRVAPTLLPVGITYDSMANGHERVFVGVGPELRGMRGLSRRETNERVGTAIRHQLTITCSQLASRYLFVERRTGTDIISRADVVAYVSRQVRRYAREGCYVDPRLLDAEGRQRRVEQYVASCLRRGILQRSTGQRYRLTESPPPERARNERPHRIIDYMNNELSAAGPH